MPLAPKNMMGLDRRRAADSLWHGFICDGVAPLGLADEIGRSWTRSKDYYKIDPKLRRPPRVLAPEAIEELRRQSEMLRLARPILEEFSARLGLAGQVLACFDGEGTMLSISGNPRTLEGVAEIDFRPGADWSEDCVGTNGPGTALAESRPMEIFASEHYVSNWQAWSCSAAPIFGPGQLAPVGLVDLTSPWEVWQQNALSIANAIARAIEERLRAAAGVRNEVVRYALRNARSNGDALIAVDARGRIIGQSDVAERRQLVEGRTLPVPARDAMLAAFARAGSAVGEEFGLALPSAPTAVGSPLLYDGAAIGAIVRVPLPGALPGTAPRRELAQAVSDSRPGVRRAPRSGARYDLTRILGSSLPVVRALELARIAAANALPVVLAGESGTGKELFAHSIHEASSRREGPFVAVNCGSIPAQLVEAELFGYESGTFTGGRSQGKLGRFEDAHGGTLFLDEVSELSPSAQTALLRVLQEKEVVRLGSSSPRSIDVRIVAATNKPLDEEMGQRRFRKDLYFRLNVLSIPIPPLRERTGDLEPLARAFLAEAEPEVGRSGLSLAPDALALLEAYAWPGNVRELKNVLLRAAATAPSPLLTARDFALEPDSTPQAPEPAAPQPPKAGPATLRETLQGSAQDALRVALDRCEWNLRRAAEELGISRMTLYRRLAKAGLARPGKPD